MTPTYQLISNFKIYLRLRNFYFIFKTPVLPRSLTILLIAQILGTIVVGGTGNAIFMLR